MKSLFIVNDFPPIIGGQSAYYYNLCQAFPLDEIVVLAPIYPRWKEFDKNQKFTIIRKPYLCSIPIVEKFFKIILPIFFAIPIIKQHDVKIIHCAHILSTGVVGFFLKKIFNIPYVIYTHSADILEFQKIGFLKKLLKIILNNAQKVVCNSHFTRRIVMSFGIEERRIILINPRIDFDVYSKEQDVESLIERYQLNNKKVILSINRLVERKGNDKVIEALSLIKKEIPEAVYLIVGKGPYEEKLKNLVKECGLKQDVIFVNSCTQEDIVQFYKVCDVFVMTSREIVNKGDAEGFGIVFLEANASGKAVVGGKSGGVEDAVIHNETGLLVEPNDINAISEAIVRILKNSELANHLGQQGKERVKNEFNLRNGIKELDFFNDF